MAGTTHKAEHAMHETTGMERLLAVERETVENNRHKFEADATKIMLRVNKALGKVKAAE